MLRYLPGIILIQLMTCGMTYAVLQAELNRELLLIMLLLSLAIAMVGGFWFSSIGRLQHRELVDRLQRKHAEERESLLVKAERDKVKVKTDSYREMEKKTRKTTAQANFKVGAVFAGAAAAGAFMLFTQFITLGTLVLTSAVTGLGGYALSMRHQRTSLLENSSNGKKGGRKKGGLTVSAEPKLIEGKPVRD